MMSFRIVIRPLVLCTVGIAVNPGASAAQSQVVLEPSRVIGEGEPQLAAITSISTDRSGNLAVLDGRWPRVLMLDTAARLQFVVGGKRGWGPSEFQFPTSVALTDSGQIIVKDYGKAALLSFSNKGQQITATRVEAHGHIRLNEILVSGNRIAEHIQPVELRTPTHVDIYSGPNYGRRRRATLALFDRGLVAVENAHAGYRGLTQIPFAPSVHVSSNRDVFLYANGRDGSVFSLEDTARRLLVQFGGTPVQIPIPRLNAEIEAARIRVRRHASLARVPAEPHLDEIKRLTTYPVLIRLIQSRSLLIWAQVPPISDVYTVVESADSVTNTRNRYILRHTDYRNPTHIAVAPAHIYLSMEADNGTPVILQYRLPQF